MEAIAYREVKEWSCDSCEGVCNNQDQVCDVFMVGQNVMSPS